MATDGDLVTGELRIGGGDRHFTIRLPRAAPDDRRIPLVLVLHGNHPDLGGWIMREWTTFDRQADTWGMAIAYPDGHGGCWADGRGVTTADEAGVDDVAFLRALTDWSADRCGTSPDRTVVAGISNGAFMAHRLALEASERVAVLAAVAGGMPAALRDVSPTHAVSALLIHGTADRISPIEGGYSRHRGPGGEPRGRTLSLEETAGRWRAIDRCPPGPGRTHTTEFSSRTTADAGVGGTRVVTWTVFGGGHSWPGAPTPPESAEPITQEFDAAEEICRFAEPLCALADTRRL
ncbi:PHB depolymerase family esterase [Actinoallomurus liliacearum]|uniref:PHB depolymerase family esterase n=1 Tax=Actinoallomurus liliacearum TaxID=1080073 RepID=A0ABP8TUL8_9ACTN